MSWDRLDELMSFLVFRSKETEERRPDHEKTKILSEYMEFKLSIVETMKY